MDQTAAGGIIALGEISAILPTGGVALRRAAGGSVMYVCRYVLWRIRCSPKEILDGFLQAKKSSSPLARREENLLACAPSAQAAVAIGGVVHMAGEHIARPMESSAAELALSKRYELQL